MKPRAFQPGFALLLAMVLVLLAGTALAAIATRSMSRALEARTAQEELQRRWAVASLRLTFASRVEDVLDRAERGREIDRDPPTALRQFPPQPFHQLSFPLAGMTCDLLFTDEQAKLNVSKMLDSQPIAQVQPRLRAVLGPSFLASSAALLLRPQVHDPLPGSPGSPGSTPKITGYGQIFTRPQPEDLLPSAQGPSLAQHLTCWGDGRVNIRRASPRVIQAACAPVLSAAALTQLQDAIAADPYQPLERILAGMKSLSVEDRPKVAALLTDHSHCHGLWITLHSSQRDWHSLAISQGAGLLPTAPSITSGTPESPADLGSPVERTPARLYIFNWSP